MVRNANLLHGQLYHNENKRRKTKSRPILHVAGVHIITTTVQTWRGSRVVLDASMVGQY